MARADLEHIPFASGSFELVTSFDVLQSVADDLRAVSEMARILKPGGHLVLNVAALELLRGHHSDVWLERQRYTRSTAARLIEDAGLELVRMSYLFASLLPLILTARTIQHVLRHWRQPQGDSDLAVPPAPINAVLTMMVKGEAALARRIPMPFGSSLLIVARKL